RDIPEFLLHQQRRVVSQDSVFRREMRARYPALYRDGLPKLPASDERPFAPIPQALPFENGMPPAGTRRLLLFLSLLDFGGVSTFALAMLEQLTAGGHQCTVVTTMPGRHAIQSEFERYADVFVPDRFLRRADYPRFLRYLIGSRGIDTVLISNSTFGYRMLP